jgi:UDP:flavonoid glycosyltransferase YjiC (YdhE family)
LPRPYEQPFLQDALSLDWYYTAAYCQLGIEIVQGDDGMTTKKLTLIALGSRGDVQPYVALGHALLQAGFRVRMMTFESFRAMVSEQGLDFQPVAGDAQELVAIAAQQGLNGTRNPITLMRAIERSYGKLAENYLAAFSAPELHDSDAILNQLPAGLFGAELAEKLNIPHILLSVIPLEPTHAFPLSLLAVRSFGIFNRATYAFGRATVAWMFRQTIPRFRAMLDLPPRAPRRSQPPIIQGFSPLVVPYLSGLAV